MKLVDILAGGLKDWPEGVAGITQGPGSGVLFDSSYQGFGRDIYLPVADDAGSPASCVKPGVTVSRAEWQAAVDALNAPKVVEWDGAGLPPVGVVCEYVDRCKFTRLVEVLAFNQDEAWLRSIGSECESHSFTTKYLDAFSPIRTAEQVASEEIEAIRQFLIYEHCDGGLIGIAKALHESGYRKESKSCGS